MLWAVTGCSGTGASTVASVWKNAGADVCSLDRVGHRFLERKSVKLLLQKELHLTDIQSLSSKEIRATLRETVFTNPEMLGKVNGILHPRLKKWCCVSASMVDNGKPQVSVLDAALVFELELENIPDFTVTVSDSLDRTVERLQKRDGISLQTALGRWRNQMDIKEKSFRSHFVIRNEAGLQELKDKAIYFYNNVIEKMEDARWHIKPGRN